MGMVMDAKAADGEFNFDMVEPGRINQCIFTPIDIAGGGGGMT